MRAPTSDLHCATSTTFASKCTSGSMRAPNSTQLHPILLVLLHFTTPEQLLPLLSLPALVLLPDVLLAALLAHCYTQYFQYCYYTTTTIQPTSTTFATRCTAGSMRAPKQRPSTHTPCDVQTKLTRKGNMLANCSYVERQYFISHSYLYVQKETLENYSFLQYLIMR